MLGRVGRRGSPGAMLAGVLATALLAPLALAGCSAAGITEAGTPPAGASGATAASSGAATSEAASSRAATASPGPAGPCAPRSAAPGPVADDGLRDRPVGVLALLSGPDVPPGWSLLDGSSLEVNANSVLFSQLGTAFGGDARPTFRLPLATGPWSQLPGPDGSCLAWALEAVGYLPDDVPRDGYPGQVYLTAVQSERLGQLLEEAGARPNELGVAIAPGIRAFDLPADWPAPLVPALPGEVRLFSESAPLPSGFAPVTDLPAPPGYAWATTDGG